MNIETKSVRYDSDVQEYKKFGWEHTEDAHKRSGKLSYTEHVLARDKDMPHYGSLVSLERKYFDLKSQKKQYNPIKGTLVLIGLLLFVLPGALYIAYKIKNKKDIDAHNRNIQAKMTAVAAEAKLFLH